MKTIYLVLLSLTVIGCRQAGAQQFSMFPGGDAPFDPYFVETRDTVSPRGPYTITRNILQDRNGTYWFATWQGIIRYDGKVFTNMTLKEGLIHFHVLTLFQDHKGDLWFGTVRGGLYRYDGKAFTLFTTKSGLAGNTINCMLEDQAGNMWFGTEGGLSRYDGKAFVNFTKEDGLSGNDVWAMTQDHTGRLWFGFTGNGGISCYDGKFFSAFTNQDGQPFKSVTSLLADKAGMIWIGRRDGLCRYDPAAGKTGGQSFTELLPNFTGSLFEDKKGSVWLSVTAPTAELQLRQLLYRYDGKSFVTVIDKYYANDWQVFGITEDQAGNIWFGTMRGAGRFDGKYSHYFWE